MEIVVELACMEPSTRSARLQDRLPEYLRQTRFRRAAIKGVMILALAVEGLAVILTLSGIPARWRELGGRGVPIPWIVNYTLTFEIMLAAVFFITAAILLYYRRADGLAVLLSLALVMLGATETGMTGALISPDWNPGGVGWHGVVYALRSHIHERYPAAAVYFPQRALHPTLDTPAGGSLGRLECCLVLLSAPAL